MRWLSSPLHHLIQLPLRAKRWVSLLVDVTLVVAAFWLALLVRHGGLGFIDQIGPLEWLTLAGTVLTAVAAFTSLGLYRNVVRFIGEQALVGIAQGVVLTSLALAVLAFMTNAYIPRSHPIIFGLLLLVAMAGVRYVVRLIYRADQSRSAEPVLIYGAGETGRLLASLLEQGVQYRPVAFLDDDPAVQGRIIQGLRVQSPAMLAKLLAKHQVQSVLLAMPELTASRRREILNYLLDYPLHVRTLPSLTRLVSGRFDPSMLQEVAVEELLGRDPVPPKPDLIAQPLADKVVLVTGAGGSIGSELCRQILQAGPRQLILYERSEYALYDIERELLALNSSVSLVPVLGSALDRPRLERLLARYPVDTLFHAAAYKHVPLVEHNVVEGVANNSLATAVLADVAQAAQVKDFVLISTDKAVRPTNVMGASKRLAEMVLQDRAATTTGTRFSMVRFGNVLGSSGSVVPLFREQIRRGGPVTVTHPDVIRYFMTIPEAAQLVLQAAGMARGGEVFILDMGEPVRIVDLARRMIRLMGHSVRDEDHPQGDIAVVFTGLRAGEKLFEELLIGDNATGTGHPMIMQAQEAGLPSETLANLLQGLREACASQDAPRVRALLAQAVVDYQPRDSDSDWLHGTPVASNVRPLHPPRG